MCIAALAAAAMGLLACSHGGGGKSGGSGSYGSGDTAVNVHLLASSVPDASRSYNVWAWQDKGSGDENVTAAQWPGDMRLKGSSVDGMEFLSARLNVEGSTQLGLLFVDGSGDPQTENIIVPAEKVRDGAELFFAWGSSEPYYSAAECAGLQSAVITSKDGKEITVVIAGEIDSSLLSVKDKDGNVLEIASVSGQKVTLKNGDISKAPYSVTYNGRTVEASVSADLIDSLYDATGETFGLTFSGSTATFKTWAPTASKVTLLLYSDSAAKNLLAEHEMKRGENGVWSYAGSYDGATYYQYGITAGSSTYKVADIWHTVAGPDSVASQIASVNTNTATPSGWKTSYTNPFTGDLYSDAVIYEMHIRDWGKAVGGQGKFTDLKNPKIIDHLKDLGVTHVQILPMFDYAEKNADRSYNWGYNPYHYNVPEGRYVTDGYTDGTQAVKEMREMIKALHDKGIAVIMDVVYNHTSRTGVNSLYDMTVPQYFYRMTGGTYSNGSGCGNEVATNRKMVKKYVIESLKHWMKDYHINGFRFDLMGCHEQSFMTEVYKELSMIDSKVMVYGEPWTGGTASVVSGCTGAVAADSAGAGAFDDDFRDAIKGAEFGGFQKGQVQGTYKDDGIVKGLTGKSGENGRNKTGNPALALHYVECHDNYTLFDKLAISYLNRKKFSGDLFAAIRPEGLEEVKKQDKLAAAYVFLSQGTPFINGGQEFLRTKQGDENSYKSSDSINAIALGFKTKYADVYNTYKGLIALRKANKVAFGASTTATAQTVSEGITKYTTGDFLVYFNATKEAVPIDTNGYTTAMEVSGGSPVESTTVPTKVPAKGFVILKK